MQDYKDYVTSINKIFDYVSKIKAGWNNQDNLANIEKIDEYRSLVANCADEFKKPAAEVVDELEEETETTTTTSHNDELTFPEPDLESDIGTDTTRINDDVHKSEYDKPQDGPVELKSELPDIDTKTDFTLSPINLPNETIIPEKHKSTQLAKLDTSNIPTLEEEGDE